MPRYPLAENDQHLGARSGRALSDVSLEALTAGALAIEDVQISAETLRAQAEIARDAGYSQLATNLERAAELTAVPNADVLRMYEMLRPSRASFDELAALAAELEDHYAARQCAALVREAADVYRQRGLLRAN